MSSRYNNNNNTRSNRFHTQKQSNSPAKYQQPKKNTNNFNANANNRQNFTSSQQLNMQVQQTKAQTGFVAVEFSSTPINQSKAMTPKLATPSTLPLPSEQSSISPIPQPPPTTPSAILKSSGIETNLNADSFDNDSNSMLSGGGGDETGTITTKKPWFRRYANKNRRKPSIREKRIRRNRTLRKILTPKNALMSLYELTGNTLSEYKIVADENGFLAEVLVNNIRYEGHGSSKIAAKNNASEKALRDLIIQKMIMKPRTIKLMTTTTTTTTVNNGSGNGDCGESISQNEEQQSYDEDVEIRDATDDDNEIEPREEEVPMMHLASFALHKLFTEWQSDGFEIPDFKIGTVNPHNKEAPAKKPPAERTDLPANAEQMHPSMLLSVMRPSTNYVELGTEGSTPNILHRVGVTLNNKQYVGIARSKKAARKAAAIEACNSLFNTNFIPESSLPFQPTITPVNN